MKEMPVETTDTTSALVKTTGDSLRIGALYEDDNGMWRILSLINGKLFVITMDSFEIKSIPVMDCIERFESGQIHAVYEPPAAYPTLSDDEMEKIKARKAVLDSVIEEMHGDLELLFRQKIRKACLDSAAIELGVSRRYLRRLLKKYLSSGKDPYSLMDHRYFNKRHVEPDVIAEVDGQYYDVKKLLKEGLVIFKTKKSVQGAYDDLVRKYFRRPVEINGKILPMPYPDSEIPVSYKMLYTYISNNLGGRTIKQYKKGERETRNNDRLKPGNVRYGLTRLGQCYQVDEVELPVQIIDPDTGIRIGKAIVYVAVEAKTGTIVAVEIGYDNNSCIGFSSLFMTMLEPHNEQTKRYGIECTSYDFPSLAIPDKILCDHGSEYESKALIRGMGEIMTTVEFVPVACGSSKGLVENVNNRLQIWIKTHVVEGGVVKQDYKGAKTAAEEACMTLEDIRAIVYDEVLYINRHPIEDWSPDMGQLCEGVVPSPAELYKYEIERSGNPANVTDRNRINILYSLMARVDDKRRFSFCDEGIRYAGHPLRWFSEENWFEDMLRDNDYKRLNETVEVRYNDYSIAYVYIKYKDIIHAVPLSAKREEQKSLKRLNWNLYDMLYKEYQEKMKPALNISYGEKLTMIDKIEETAETAKALTQRQANGKSKKGKKANKDSVRKARATAKTKQAMKDDETRNRLMDKMNEAVGATSVSAETSVTADKTPELPDKKKGQQDTEQIVSETRRPKRLSAAERAAQMDQLLD